MAAEHGRIVFSPNSFIPVNLFVSMKIAELIQRATGIWSDEGWICIDDLNRYRHEYVKSLLEAERGELTALDKEVLESLRQQEILSRNPEKELQSGLTAGQRVADRVAAFGGSWRFLTLFAVVLFLWIAVNSVVLIILHAAHDYQVNLKAELEIRHLHQKLDHLLSHQWERLVEIQEIESQSRHIK
jgi:uncharacterized membrane protein